MAELKTKQTEASVEDYLDTIEDPRRRADCEAISALMKRVTKFEPKMSFPRGHFDQTRVLFSA